MSVLKFMWALPLMLIKSKLPQLDDDHRQKTRRRPLRTCGDSALTIVQNSCRKAQDCSGLIGFVVKWAIILFGYIVPVLVHQWLTVLSFIDDYILIVENLVEKIFPSSKTLFDKVDSLVDEAEVLPQKIDDFCVNFPIIWHQFHFLDLVFGNSIATQCDPNNTSEKEILVDFNYKGESESIEKSGEDLNFIKDSKPMKSFSSKTEDEDASKDVHAEPSIANLSEVIHKSLTRLKSLESERKSIYGFTDSSFYGSFQTAVSSPVSECSQDDDKISVGKDEALKCSYKDVVKRGANGNREMNGENGGIVEKDLMSNKDEKMLKDQILELFEESWHMM